jgi:hypothetical protein
MGSDSVRNGIFIATEKRLVFYAKKMFGFDLESLPYSNISSIEMSKGFMGHSIAFFASGNSAKMKWINEGDVPAFVEYVRGRIGKKEAPAATSTEAVEPDVVGQIQKLAELKEAGILTEEEFSSKKQELLARM